MKGTRGAVGSPVDVTGADGWQQQTPFLCAAATRVFGCALPPRAGPSASLLRMLRLHDLLATRFRQRGVRTLEVEFAEKAFVHFHALSSSSAIAMRTRPGQPATGSSRAGVGPLSWLRPRSTSGQLADPNLQLTVGA